MHKVDHIIHQTVYVHYLHLSRLLFVVGPLPHYLRKDILLNSPRVTVSSLFKKMYGL